MISNGVVKGGVFKTLYCYLDTVREAVRHR